MNCQTEIRYGFVNNSGSIFYCPPCVDRGHIPKDDPLTATEQAARLAAAHEVPFAYEPDKIVVEKFTLEITTPEQPDYCGCIYCKNQRSAVLRSIIEAKLKNCFHDLDPFRVFPAKQTITALPCPS